MKSAPNREEVPLDRASTFRRGLGRLGEAGAWLRGADPLRVDRAIVAAASMLGDPGSPLGRQAREILPSRAVLSPAMIDWALTTTLETVTLDALAACRAALARATHPHELVPARLHAVVLSSNLFTASLKPIVWSLLTRAPVALKLSSADEGLAELFALALSLVDDEVGRAVLPTRFSRTDEDLTRSLLGLADAVSIYGSDLSVEAVRALVPASAEIIAHGHGLGMVFVGRDAGEEELHAQLPSLALDVAAYDQRGCLSPHAILVEEGGVVSPRDVAEGLVKALSDLAKSLPRASLTVAESTRQVQWRRVSEALGELFEGDGYAVAFEDRGPLRSCPLARNIAVHSVADRRALFARLHPLGVHLKCLAVLGAPRPELSPPLAPRLTTPGFMQRPTLLDLHDGRAPWHGLVRLR